MTAPATGWAHGIWKRGTLTGPFASGRGLPGTSGPHRGRDLFGVGACEIPPENEFVGTLANEATFFAVFALALYTRASRWKNCPRKNASLGLHGNDS